MLFPSRIQAREVTRSVMALLHMFKDSPKDGCSPTHPGHCMQGMSGGASSPPMRQAPQYMRRKQRGFDPRRASVAMSSDFAANAAGGNLAGSLALEAVSLRGGALRA